MTSDWRMNLRRKHLEDTVTLLDELGNEPLSEDDYDSQSRQDRLEALRQFNPAATLEEELRLRILGDSAGGTMRFDWGSALMKPLQESVAAASAHPIDLELVGLSQGSTVMHVRPVAQTEDLIDTLPTPVDGSVADNAVRRLMNLTDALENEADVRQHVNLLDAVDGLTEALDRFDLAMELRWFGPAGPVRKAAITSKGRAYAKRLRTTRTEDTEIPISGRITELRESGLVKVKMGLARNASAWEVKVGKDDLLAMRLVLGQDVSFIVRQSRMLDSVGRTRSTQHHFVRMQSHNPPML